LEKQIITTGIIKKPGKVKIGTSDHFLFISGLALPGS